MRKTNENYIIVLNTPSEYWDLRGNLKYYNCSQAHKTARRINREAGYRAAVAIKLESAYSAIHPNVRRRSA